MPKIMLRDQLIRFPSVAEASSMGEGEPAYGAKFPIDPNGPSLKLIEDAMLEAATGKWEKEGPAILAMLIENKKVAFERKTYKDKKGQPYGGFEGMFTLGSRTSTAKPRPSVFDKHGDPLIVNGDFVAGKTKSDVERLIYDGCRVHASVEIWAQSNTFGQRVNCSLLGVMFAGDGTNFGGGSGPATADDFSGLAQKVDPEEAMGEDDGAGLV